MAQRSGANRIEDELTHAICRCDTIDPTIRRVYELLEHSMGLTEPRAAELA